MAGLPYAQDIAGALGAGGLDRSAFERLTAALGPDLEDLQRQRRSGEAAVLAAADRTDDLGAIEAAAAAIADGAGTVAVLGTGGSSLGGQTLVRLVDHGFGPAPGRPRVAFFDNVDPATFQALFKASDPATTRVIAISKSGGTAETLLQTLTCQKWLADAVGPARAAAAFTVLTEPKDSPLARFAASHGMTTLAHDLKIGGRYSALTNVGLLPAAIAGVDIRAVRAGASAALDASLLAAPEASPAALGAALSVGLARDRGCAVTVMMPYIDALQPFAFWFRQLWAESLGKDGQGTLPANALGAVDQHSQLQLYLAGPADKMFTLILGAAGGGPTPMATDDPDLRYLNGRPLGDLLGAEQEATAATLIANQRPTRIFRIGQADAATLGALMAHFELETILAARLLKVDPFDQPAVEEGKALARRYLESARTRG